MFLSLFGRSSRSGVHEHWENHRLTVNLAAKEAQVERFLAAYVVESKHPDCAPGYRFRVQLPNGVTEHRATRDEAEALLLAVLNG